MSALSNNFVGDTRSLVAASCCYNWHHNKYMCYSWAGNVVAI